MDTQLKKKYIGLLQVIYSKLEQTDVLERLENINGVILFEYYEVSDDFEDALPLENRIPLAYIYKKRFLTNPTDLYKARTQKSDPVDKEIYISYLKSIALSLNEYSLTDIFDDVQKLMGDNYVKIDIPGAPDDIYHLFLNYINIYIDNIEIISLMGTDDPRSIYAEDIFFEKDKVFNKIDGLRVKSISSLNKNIENKVWFDYLSEESKQLIIAGENLILNFTKELEEENKNRYDLSSFLLPFVKAIECEVPNLVERYLSKLLDLSNEIIRRTEKIDNVKTIKKYNPLINLSKLIQENQRKVNKINSISNLYFIIHYFGFVENMELIENAKSVFEDSLITHLRKEDRIIEELKHLGEDRNNFIHSKLITQISEFRLHYERLTLILEFLAMFKQMSKQSN